MKICFLFGCFYVGKAQARTKTCFPALCACDCRYLNIVLSVYSFSNMTTARDSKEESSLSPSPYSLLQKL